MFSISVSGSFHNTESFLSKMQRYQILDTLRKYGSEGSKALAKAFPVDTGLASQSWQYGVSAKRGVYSITWFNRDIEKGFPVVIMLQYGHGTGTGGYVQGYDYINPAIRPVMDKIADDVWKVVTSA